MPAPGRCSRAAPGRGLSALAAAVGDARHEEALRRARARSITCDLLDGRTGVRSRIATEAVGGAGTTSGPLVPAQAGAPGVQVPSPSRPLGSTSEPVAAAEGDAALSLALVQRAQTGDAEAFGELYDRYVDLVYRYISYRVGSPQLAEDLTSETFLRALRRITSFTWQGRDVGAWFVTIARNLIADHYKSGRHRLESTTDDVATSAGPGVLVQDGPEDEVLESMQNQVLLAAVRQLGAEQQECVVLRFLQGMSVAETAQAMGKNEGAVKALQYRAIRTLGRLLPEGVAL